MKVDLTVNGKEITADVEDRMLLVEGLLDRVHGAVAGQALNGGDLVPAGLGGEHRARLHGLAVEQHRAGPAGGGVAADVCRGEVGHVAQALLEEVRYDADANPLTSTLVDYAAITAPELPSFELVASETPTSINPLGAKGIGEAGTIGSTPAVLNAVIDAVSHLGVRHIDMPATPERVWAAINEARASR